MTNRVTYEWLVERSDEFGDILDVRHFDTLADAKTDVEGSEDEDREAGLTIEIGLVRDRLDDLGVAERGWAYLRADGTLPSHFNDTEADRWPVPKRFHQEAAR